MTGHQPTLFHPGVWFKNFLLSSIGKSEGGTAVNLVVDTDTLRTPGIRVPTCSDGEARIVDVLFDAPGDEVPWEVRHVIDSSTFDSFPRRVHEALSSQIVTARNDSQLLLDRLWSNVKRVRDREADRVALDLKKGVKGNNLLERIVDGFLAEYSPTTARCLAGARHQIELEAGLVSHEACLSSLFFHHFAYFAEMLIKRHEEFRSIHNTAVAEYRALHRIRSRAHPVPDLAREGKWVEVPLWMWSIGKPLRRRVFARSLGNRWEITDREGLSVPVGAGNSSHYSSLFEFGELQGIKLRPRALITTMYSRLVLSDLFIHGIGGAKYDELTDEIIRRFFGIEPPRYLTATATFRLPIDRPQVTIDDVRNAARLVRDARYRPETLVGHPLVASDAARERELLALAAQKREYVRSHTIRKASHNVFTGLDRINASMREKLQPLERHLRAELARLAEQLKQGRLLGSREFSFVLYPEEYLVPRLLALAAAEK